MLEQMCQREYMLEGMCFRECVGGICWSTCVRANVSGGNVWLQSCRQGMVVNFLVWTLSCVPV